MDQEKYGETFDLHLVKEALEECYPKEDKEILETKNGKRINNLPLNNLDDDIFFYLSIKVQLAKHLYFLVNFEINKKFDIDHLHLGISYIKIYCLIIQYYLQKNDRITIYCLLNLFNLKDYFTYWIQTLS